MLILTSPYDLILNLIDLSLDSLHFLPASAVKNSNLNCLLPGLLINAKVEKSPILDRLKIQ